MTSVSVSAEPISQIRVGAYYYKQGILSDTKVEVLSVDRSRDRVKIFNTETSQVEWVSPSQLLTLTDSQELDAERVGVAVDLLTGLVEAIDESTSWAPGSKHPSHPNVVASNERGKWTPAPGYVWVDALSSTNYAVRWSAGKTHPTHPNVVASPSVGKWRPAPGYVWIDSTKSWAVKWSPGVRHPSYANVVASEKANVWSPALGYAWTDRGNSWAVRWNSGASHPNRKGVIAGQKAGTWVPSAGYAWASESDRLQLRATWTPKSKHPTRPNWFALFEEGKWVDFELLRNNAREAERAAAGNWPAPRGVESTSFERGDVRFRSREDGWLAIIEHWKPLDHDDIVEVVFNYEDRSVMVVRSDGSRHDVGNYVRSDDLGVWAWADAVELRSIDAGGGITATKRMPLTVEWTSGTVRSDALVIGITCKSVTGVRQGARTIAGVSVNSVYDGGPAERAGLRRGDVIVRIDNSAVETIEDLTSAIGKTSGRRVEFGIVRDGVLLTTRMSPVRERDLPK